MIKRAFLGIVCIGFVLAIFGYWALSNTYRGFGSETFIEIPHGTSTKRIASELAEAGVIRYPWQFWLARALRPDAKLQAGEYRFADATSVQNVFDRIARGDIFSFEFTVPEGSNMFDIARSLESQGILQADAFLDAAANTASIHDLAPKAKNLEGFLFPSTYRLSHKTTAAQLCNMMTTEFRHEWTKLTRKASDGESKAVIKRPDAQTAGTVASVVTLASLVEKETGAADERPLVASVFNNRLSKGMRLECDPTTIYAALLDNRYHGVIHRSDLASTNPYNTYQNEGLPPGPIANPGASALEAALHPASTDFLFFVAKPNGGKSDGENSDGEKSGGEKSGRGRHQFSASLAEHAQAVAQYRHATNKRKAN